MKTPAPDGTIAGILVRQLWQVGAVPEGDAALDASVKQFPEDGLRLSQARRMYQSGRYAELLAVKPLATDRGSFVACLKGYQALALAATGKTSEAATLRKELAADTGTLLAQDWAAVLGYMFDPNARFSRIRRRWP